MAEDPEDLNADFVNTPSSGASEPAQLPPSPQAHLRTVVNEDTGEEYTTLSVPVEDDDLFVQNDEAGNTYLLKEVQQQETVQPAEPLKPGQVVQQRTQSFEQTPEPDDGQQLQLDPAPISAPGDDGDLTEGDTPFSLYEVMDVSGPLRTRADGSQYEDPIIAFDSDDELRGMQRAKTLAAGLDPRDPTAMFLSIAEHLQPYLSADKREDLASTTIDDWIDARYAAQSDLANGREPRERFAAFGLSARTSTQHHADLNARVDKFLEDEDLDWERDVLPFFGSGEEGVAPQELGELAAANVAQGVSKVSELYPDDLNRQLQAVMAAEALNDQSSYAFDRTRAETASGLKAALGTSSDVFAEQIVEKYDLRGPNGKKMDAGDYKAAMRSEIDTLLLRIEDRDTYTLGQLMDGLELEDAGGLDVAPAAESSIETTQAFQSGIQEDLSRFDLHKILQDNDRAKESATEFLAPEWESALRQAAQLQILAPTEGTDYAVQTSNLTEQLALWDPEQGDLDIEGLFPNYGTAMYSLLQSFGPNPTPEQIELADKFEEQHARKMGYLDEFAVLIEKSDELQLPDIEDDGTFTDIWGKEIRIDTTGSRLRGVSTNVVGGVTSALTGVVELASAVRELQAYGWDMAEGHARNWLFDDRSYLERIERDGEGRRGAVINNAEVSAAMQSARAHTYRGLENFNLFSDDTPGTALRRYAKMSEQYKGERSVWGTARDTLTGRGVGETAGMIAGTKGAGVLVKGGANLATKAVKVATNQAVKAANKGATRLRLGAVLQTETALATAVTKVPSALIKATAKTAQTTGQIARGASAQLRRVVGSKGSRNLAQAGTVATGKAIRNIFTRHADIATGVSILEGNQALNAAFELSTEEVESKPWVQHQRMLESRRGGPRKSTEQMRTAFAQREAVVTAAASFAGSQAFMAIPGNAFTAFEDTLSGLARKALRTQVRQARKDTTERAAGIFGNTARAARVPLGLAGGALQEGAQESFVAIAGQTSTSSAADLLSTDFLRDAGANLGTRETAQSFATGALLGAFLDGSAAAVRRDVNRVNPDPELNTQNDINDAVVNQTPIAQSQGASQALGRSAASGGTAQAASGNPASSPAPRAGSSTQQPRDLQPEQAANARGEAIPTTAESVVQTVAPEVQESLDSISSAATAITAKLAAESDGVQPGDLAPIISGLQTLKDASDEGGFNERSAYEAGLRQSASAVSGLVDEANQQIIVSLQSLIDSEQIRVKQTQTAATPRAQRVPADADLSPPRQIDWAAEVNAVNEMRKLSAKFRVDNPDIDTIDYAVNLDKQSHADAMLQSRTESSVQDIPPIRGIFGGAMSAKDMASFQEPVLQVYKEDAPTESGVGSSADTEPQIQIVRGQNGYLVKTLGEETSVERVARADGTSVAKPENMAQSTYEKALSIIEVQDHFEGEAYRLNPDLLSPQAHTKILNLQDAADDFAREALAQAQFFHSQAMELMEGDVSDLYNVEKTNSGRIAQAREMLNRSRHHADMALSREGQVSMQGELMARMERGAPPRKDDC